MSAVRGTVSRTPWSVAAWAGARIEREQKEKGSRKARGSFPGI